MYFNEKNFCSKKKNILCSTSTSLVVLLAHFSGLFTLFILYIFIGSLFKTPLGERQVRSGDFFHIRQTLSLINRLAVPVPKFTPINIPFVI